MFWTKRAHQCTIFQAFGCSNESSPNSSCHFWNRKVRIYSNFTSLFSVMKDNSSAFFNSNLILWTKIAHQSEIFGLSSGWVKIYQIPHVIFETTSQYFCKPCIALQCHEKISLKIILYFFSSNFIWILQKEPSKVQNFRLSTALVTFHQIWTLIGSFCWK